MPSNEQAPFSFPRMHSFPPFYTAQPNRLTAHAQLQKWASLILSYARHYRLWKISLADDSELFHNRAIGRRLSHDYACEVVDFMRGMGRAEWVRDAKGAEPGACSVFWVWWKKPDEWAECIAAWVDETGQRNTVLTLYELTESEATVSQDFHGMDAEVLQKALAVLVKRGKAQVFGQEDQKGIKFF